MIDGETGPAARTIARRLSSVSGFCSYVVAPDDTLVGALRTHGELATVGVVLAPSNVWAILRRHAVEPSPRRSGPTWSESLRAQATTMPAGDVMTSSTSTRCSFVVSTCSSPSISTPRGSM